MEVPIAIEQVNTVRAFNRFYTGMLGLLEKKLLQTQFSLPYARVMYEIAARGVASASDLVEELKMDPGYLSRLLGSLEKQKFVKRRKSKKDGRRYLLSLTPNGEKAYAVLNQAANDQIKELLSSLPDEQREELVSLFYRAHRVLAPDSVSSEQIIFRDHRPGDIGFISYRHGVLYQREYGFNDVFEAYVAEGLAGFVNSRSSNREKLWVVESDGRVVGAIGITEASKKTAQLRWLYLEPELRGRGLGRKLIEEAVSFSRSKNYKNIILWSVDKLKQARKLYRKAGFVLSERKTQKSWGREVTQEKWELDL